MKEKREKTGITDKDKQLIKGLKEGDPETIRRFFHEELNGLLRQIQYDLFDGRVEYDELVSELFIYLSADKWARLDRFEGKNGCRLRTWMSPVAWRYFIGAGKRLSGNSAGGGQDDHDSDDWQLEKAIEVAIDVNAALERMPNQRYARCLVMMLQEGLSAEEVAEAWNTNAANVYNIKLRAIRQFIKSYGDRKKR